jgi:hypothetical protein
VRLRRYFSSPGRLRLRASCCPHRSRPDWRGRSERIAGTGRGGAHACASEDFFGALEQRPLSPAFGLVGPVSVPAPGKKSLFFLPDRPNHQPRQCPCAQWQLRARQEWQKQIGYPNRIWHGHARRSYRSNTHGLRSLSAISENLMELGRSGRADAPQ